MWLNRFTNYLLSHRYQTMALVFLSTFVPIVGVVGILIAALVTLRKDVLQGAILTLLAALPYVICFYVTRKHETAVPIVVWAAVGVAVTSNVLTWVFALMWRRGTRWAGIIQIAALLGVLVVSVVHLIYPEVTDWWSNELQSYYTQAANVAETVASEVAVSPETKQQQLDAINVTRQYATGLMVAAVLLNAILQLLVARWWEVVVFAPRTLRRELCSIRLAPLTGVLFVASLILAYMGNAVVLDIMPILYALFCAAGLSIAHYFFGVIRSQTAWFWVVLFYLIFIFSLPTSVILISVLALFDIWLDLRKRFTKV